MNNSIQATQAQRFAALHREDGIIVMPNCWDAGSACVLADAGFGAIATTSGGCAFSLGYCDGETAAGRDAGGGKAYYPRSVDPG